MHRCEWATNEHMIAYHDTEWGVPLHNDRVLFEFLVLAGAQAGLSWDTILKKRENYRKAMDNFDPVAVAGYGKRKIAELRANPGIVRNRLKIAATVKNAKAFLAIKEEFGTFDAYIWRFVDGKTIKNTWRKLSEIPATTPLSDAMSKDLKQHHFTFVGPTICYAFMQTVGMVNDHTMDCFRYNQVGISSRPSAATKP